MGQLMKRTGGRADPQPGKRIRSEQLRGCVRGIALRVP
ncbi:hypothetical protein [Cyanobium sp. ATX 6A2]